MKSTTTLQLTLAVIAALGLAAPAYAQSTTSTGVTNAQTESQTDEDSKSATQDATQAKQAAKDATAAANTAVRASETGAVTAEGAMAADANADVATSAASQAQTAASQAETGAAQAQVIDLGCEVERPIVVAKRRRAKAWAAAPPDGTQRPHAIVVLPEPAFREVVCGASPPPPVSEAQQHDTGARQVHRLLGHDLTFA